MILITGGIGSGKSVVSRVLRLRGFGVFDCDMEAGRLMAPEGPLAGAINEILGEDVYIGGTYNRARVSDIIFSSQHKRQVLNSLVHGEVRKALERWKKEAENNRFVECAIAAQSGVLDMAAGVILVEASPECRIKRVGMRDGHSVDKIRSIMEAQKREEDLIRACSLPLSVIKNDGPHSILARLDEALIQLSAS